jgi:predicted nucleic acid-binding protein
MKYLIDTDIASYFLRGRHNLDETFRKKGLENLATSVVTLGELKVLAYKNPQSSINLSSISYFSKSIVILDLDPETWDIFAKVKAVLLQQGKKRGDFDILNASLAKQHGLVIVTNNVNHYSDLGQVENWVEGLEKALPQP